MPDAMFDRPGDEGAAGEFRPGDTARAEFPRMDESVWSFAGRRLRRILIESLGLRALV
jgi:hypothetical protein